LWHSVKLSTPIVESSAGRFGEEGLARTRVELVSRVPLLEKLLLRAGPELKRITRRPFAPALSPFRGAERPKLIHCCYHKVGTTWFSRVLRDVAATHGMRFAIGHEYPAIHRLEHDRDIDVFVDPGCHVELDAIGPFVGSHMLRDPRDVVVSAYFYHRWTQETWANIPMAQYRNMTYREYLNAVDQDEGIATEIERAEFWVRQMLRWNYSDPRILEIRYEDIRVNERETFRALFTHYGFHDAAVERSCRIAARYTFDRRAGGPGTHLRSGAVGEWRDYFRSFHKDLFKKRYPTALERLGYEKDENW